MPALIARLLPHGLVLLSMIAAIWWIDHRGYRRAIADRELSDARLTASLHAELRRSEQALTRAIDRIAADYDGKRSALAARYAAIQPLLIREIARENRLADPALGLSPGLLDAVNRARATGACTATAAGSAACALPAPAPDR